MTEPFVSNSLPYSHSLAHAVAAVSPAVQTDIKPQGGNSPQETGSDTEDNSAGVADWQPDETSLFPGFGVERARELLQWIINLRLPPYGEASPA